MSATGADGRGDAGESLIEVVISLMLIAIALSGVLGAVAASADLSGGHQADAVAAAELRSFAEAVEAAAYDGTGVTYQAAAELLLPGRKPAYDVRLTEVRCWAPGSSDAAAWLVCNAGRDRGLQAVDLQVSYGKGAGVQRTTVLKRNPL